MKKYLIVPMFILGVVIAFASITKKESKSNIVVLNSKEIKPITYNKLSNWILEGRKDFIVIDLRETKKFKKEHIKTAISCYECVVGKVKIPKIVKNKKENSSKKQKIVLIDKIVDKDYLFEKGIDLSLKVVVYTNKDRKKIKLVKDLLLNDHKKTELFYLRGGFETWEKELLTKVNYKNTDTEEDILVKAKKNAIRAYYKGEGIQPPKLNFKFKRVRRTSSGKNEGC